MDATTAVSIEVVIYFSRLTNSDSVHLEPNGKAVFMADVAEWILSRAKEQGTRIPEADQMPSKL